METRSVNGLTLVYDAGEREAADIIGDACQQAIHLIHEQWGLETPADCHVYVMTSWTRFFLQSAPWPRRAVNILFLPLLYVRIRRLWSYIGGWAIRYGKRRVIGVKPPRLMLMSDTSMGERIYIKELDVANVVRNTTCHELTHAFAAHLKLPMWLNEGLAMLTVDKFRQKPTVIPETVETLTQPQHPTGPGSYRRVSAKDIDTMIYYYVRGYWLTRYLEETQPDLLQRLLSRRIRHWVLEREIAKALGLSEDTFWPKINRVVAAHFMGAVQEKQVTPQE